MTASIDTSEDTRQRPLRRDVEARTPEDASALLAGESPALTASILLHLNPGFACDILDCLEGGYAAQVACAVPSAIARQWDANRRFESGHIGRLMEPALAVFGPEATVAQTVESLRGLIRTTLVTYCYVVDDSGQLIGVITMRDLLFAGDDDTLGALMLRSPFRLAPDMLLADAMKLTLQRHFPVYPVCDAEGRLIGQVRGQAMFEAQAFDITAQAGTMVGVEKEERLSTPWGRSLKFRHPWLQLNLLTAFVAGAVVGLFEHTVERLVVLAAFLPVLAGQSGNTGCQALAVTLRGLTLGELRPGEEKALVMKEASLGFMNGAFTGLVAASGMFIYASAQGSAHAVMLSAVVWLALVAACVTSGVCGAMIPLTLKRFGADPATASSIFLTTATDVVSMGLLLGLASVLVR